MAGGKRIDAYIPWNEYSYFDSLRTRKMLTARLLEFIEKQKWSDLPENDPRIFNRWIATVNYVAGLKDNSSELRLLFPNDLEMLVYKKLQRIEYPSRCYMPAEEDVLKFPVSRIASIKANPELPLNVDLQISVIPQSRINQLKEKPKYSVSIEYGVGADVYVVYGDVSLTQMLEYVDARYKLNSDKSERLLINNTEILPGGVGCAGLGALEDQCNSFVKKAEAGRRTVNAAGTKAVDFKSLPGRWEKYNLPCGSSTIAKESGSKDFFSKETDELCSRGIISFSYGWD